MSSAPCPGAGARRGRRGCCVPCGPGAPGGRGRAQGGGCGWASTISQAGFDNTRSFHQQLNNRLPKATSLLQDTRHSTSPRTTRRGVWRHGRRRRTRVTSPLGHRGGLRFHEGLIRAHVPKHRTARCRLCRPRWSGLQRGSQGGSRGGGHTALGEGTGHRPGVVRRHVLQFRYS
jgi:hypothetical protein